MQKEKEKKIELPEEEDYLDQENNDIDEDFSLDENVEESSKKRKRSFDEVLGKTKGSLPPGWSHIRISPHKVWPEYYRVVDLLVSRFHCSMDQAVAAVVDFVMTDSVSHNKGVEEIVAEALEVDHLPSHLLCNVHPSLMFVRVALKLFVEIGSTLTAEKIYAGFTITVTDQQISVFQNCVDCTHRLISRDFNHKAWNKAEEFERFKAPQRFNIKRLQMERFNSLVFSAGILCRHLPAG